MIRLVKLIAQSSQYSRRQSQILIRDGRVSVLGQPALAGDWVFDVDVGDVCIDGKPLQVPELIYLAYHKPVGVDCNCVADDPASIVHHVKPDSGLRVFPVGRLDKDSHGLIFLTNDGDFSHRLMHSESHQEKTYRVQVNKPLDRNFAQAMAAGIPVKRQITRACLVEVISPREFKITLSQGLNRQIRKMCQYLGYRVTDLQRIKIKNFELGDLKVGSWRYIEPEHIFISEMNVK